MAVLALSCAVHPASDTTVASGSLDPEPAEASGPPELEPAPRPSARLLPEGMPEQIAAIDSWFAGHGTRRLHIQLDRPLYRPGESVWVKSWNVRTRTLIGEDSAGIVYQLVDPRGQVAETKSVLQSGGTATNDFVLSADAPGGQWKLRATLPTGETDERPFVVASYASPRIHKDLEFLREAYGPGEIVEALVELEIGAGGPLADHPVRALLQVDGQTVLEQALRTDRTGAVLVRAALPESLTSGDGLLTVLVDQGGVTESISRSVPIVLSDLSLSFFPEGGDLVAGLPGRVYFEGRDRHGEPADVSGWIEDDLGERVAGFSSVHDGMGRVAFTPAPGRRYTAHISAPSGIGTTFPLPEAAEQGCTLRSFDDLRSELQEIRVAVRCSSRQDVAVVGTLREQTVDRAMVGARPDADAVVYLSPPAALADLQGAVRVTVFDRQLDPLAERLIYRNRGKDLRIEITPDRERYSPRDEVKLSVRATRPSGEPVAAELALSVVDDAVLGLADDEEGHLLTRMYLEPELVESPEDPGWYFDPEEALAARGLDLVLGTRGYRRFEWHRVWAEPEPVADSSRDERRLRRKPTMAVPMVAETAVAAVAAVDALEGEALPQDVALAMPAQAPPPLAAPMAGLAMPLPAVDLPPAVKAPKEVVERAQAQRRDARGPAAGGRAFARELAERDDHAELGFLGYVGDLDMPAQGWAPVRVFPKPDHQPGFEGPRTDFRDTVLWEPAVRTDADGRAEIRFPLSDAVATFRVIGEGLGAGYAGHGEATVRSVLPVSVSARVPSAVSAGDRLLVPLTVSNTRPREVSVVVRGRSDSGLVRIGAPEGRLRVGAGGSDTSWMPVEVGSGSGLATLQVSVEGEGASDAVEQGLAVVPSGFPRTWSAAGELASGVAELRFTLEEVVPGSLSAEATWHPSPVSTLITGMEGLIREPGGCFEQTSSTNWPNVAILSYLEAHDGDPRLRAQSSRALGTGYKLLTGYQVQAGGFETFGQGPGKEALSAFGLLQFADMKRVYPVEDRVLERDVTYLLSQRDGKGGFLNSGESSHGYGSAPQPVLDGFITWSLVSTGHGSQLSKELARQAEVALSSQDPYVLALAARSLLASGHPSGAKAVERLAAMQDRDGSFPGAESSITRSWEANLLVESTALSALALMDAGGAYRIGADRAAAWLVSQRQGQGTWGATQATALALSALTAHAEQSRRPASSGRLSVEVNGRQVGTLAYAAGQTEPLVIRGFEQALVKGENALRLRHDGEAPLPYTVSASWTALEPLSAPGAELGLEASLDRTRARMGETVRLTARVANRTRQVVPSPIARIGLPAGLEPQLWQLKELKERGEIAFFETRPREVTLYWEGVHPESQHQVQLDLLAAVPGEFTGPASSAYPYYDDDEKAWDAGLAVTIAPR